MTPSIRKPGRAAAKAPAKPAARAKPAASKPAPARRARSIEKPAGNRYALVIALERVGAAFYTNWQGTLDGAVADAAMMTDLLDNAGFRTVTLANERATRDAVARAFAELAALATGGDLIVVYFSGHGTTLPDLNGDEPQDGVDEVWCLHDGMFVDDERDECLTRFAAGVRIVVIADSCFSGNEATKQIVDAVRNADANPPVRQPSKLAPADIGERVYEVQKDYYNPILNRPPVDLFFAPASILLLSACGENELARYDRDGQGSVFTRAIVRTWDGGRFGGTYKDLAAAVSTAVKTEVPTQSPQLFSTGATRGTPLEDQRAFR